VWLLSVPSPWLISGQAWLLLLYYFFLFFAVGVDQNCFSVTGTRYRKWFILEKFGLLNFLQWNLAAVRMSNFSITKNESAVFFAESAFQLFVFGTQCLWSIRSSLLASIDYWYWQPRTLWWQLQQLHLQLTRKIVAVMCPRLCFAIGMVLPTVPADHDKLYQVPGTWYHTAATCNIQLSCSWRRKSWQRVQDWLCFATGTVLL